MRPLSSSKSKRRQQASRKASTRTSTSRRRSSSFLSSIGQTWTRRQHHKGSVSSASDSSTPSLTPTLDDASCWSHQEEKSCDSFQSLSESIRYSLLRSNSNNHNKLLLTYRPSSTTVQVALWTVLLAAAHGRQSWMLGLWIGFYAILGKVLCQVGKVALAWYDYYAHEPDIQYARQCASALLTRILQEVEKAMDGDYKRLVGAGYILYNCTAPGESYLQYILRYHMSQVNRQIVEGVRFRFQ